jgi:hypothetical protein
VTQRRGAMKARKKKRKVYYIFICYIGEYGIRGWALLLALLLALLERKRRGRAE